MSRPIVSGSQRNSMLCSDRGMGASGLLVILGGIALAWWIMMTILDYISANHQKKVQDRMARFESYKPKPKVRVNRKVRGYKVKY